MAWIVQNGQKERQMQRDEWLSLLLYDDYVEMMIGIEANEKLWRKRDNNNGNWSETSRKILYIYITFDSLDFILISMHNGNLSRIQMRTPNIIHFDPHYIYVQCICLYDCNLLYIYRKVSFLLWIVIVWFLSLLTILFPVSYDRLRYCEKLTSTRNRFCRMRIW